MGWALLQFAKKVDAYDPYTDRLKKNASSYGFTWFCLAFRISPFRLAFPKGLGGLSLDARSIKSLAGDPSTRP